jgi:hypothetical protein
MSTAVVRAPIGVQPTLAVIETTAPVDVKTARLVDEHPFGVVGIFIAITLAVAGIFVASILFWLAIRYSGVLGVKL